MRRRPLPEIEEHPAAQFCTDWSRLRNPAAKSRERAEVFGLSSKLLTKPEGQFDPMQTGIEEMGSRRGKTSYLGSL
jgi:hypothetical protein